MTSAPGDIAKKALLCLGQRCCQLDAGKAGMRAKNVHVGEGVSATSRLLAVLYQHWVLVTHSHASRH